MLEYKILPKFSFYVMICFVLFTIIGTRSHELGHAVVAQYLGYDTKVSYGSMTWHYDGYEDDNDVQQLNLLLEQYSFNDYNNWPSAIKREIEALSQELNEIYPYYKSHDLYITLGGPMQTILTSIIGLIILYLRRKKWKHGLEFTDWLAIFLALFSLRAVFNFITGLYGAVIYDRANFNGDEYKISRLLGYNEWIIPFIAMVLGLLVTCYIIFKVIPIKFRFSFLLSGLIGGLLGFGMWFGFLGDIMFN